MILVTEHLAPRPIIKNNPNTIIKSKIKITMINAAELKRLRFLKERTDGRKDD